MGISSRDAGSCSSPAEAPLKSNLHGARYFRRGNPLQRGLIKVHLHLVFLLRILHVPVDIHHARSFLEDLS